MRLRLPLLLACVPACANAPSTGGEPAPIVATPAAGGSGATDPAPLVIAGFSTPESATHDPAADLYLVSNIHGDPLAKDDNGFISRVRPNGEIEALRFIDGAHEEVELHAPKGIEVRGEVMAVADIDTVRFFDRSEGHPLEQVAVPGATFLNDVVFATDDAVFVTDSGLRQEGSGLVSSGTEAIHQVRRDGTVSTLWRDSSLGSPNGIDRLPDGTLRFTTFDRGGIYDLVDGAPQKVGDAPTMLDGLVVLDADTWWASSWTARAVGRWQDDRWVPIAEGIESPADIGLDASRQRLLIPSFKGDQLVVVSTAP